MVLGLMIILELMGKEKSQVRFQSGICSPISILIEPV
jgi:hypothetical protein